MLYELSEDREEQENAEHLILQALVREWRAEEGEADEEGREEAQCEFGVDVAGCSPICNVTWLAIHYGMEC